MSKEIITQMVGQTSPGGVWKAMMEMFSLQSKARVVQFHTQLNKAHKENKIAKVYFSHIKNLADEMAASLLKKKMLSPTCSLASMMRLTMALLPQSLP
jgi:hypothetical protein